MTRSATRVTGGHLSLAHAPSRLPRAPPRAVLLSRVICARTRVLWLNLLALAGTVVALAPLVLRRGPLGHRAQVPRTAARVIAFRPRRRTETSSVRR